MMTLVIAIFAASVLGSLHCAGMCGAFLAIALGEERGVRTQAAYHLGRLATYTALGAAAGALGQALNLGAALAGIEPVAMAVAGGTIVVFGVVSLLKVTGVRLAGAGMPGWVRGMTGALYRLAMGRGVVVRAAMIGLMTTLLPCGWLYAFVATAAGTGSPVRGGLAMMVFWAGTLPLLVAVGAGVRGMLGSLGARLPVVTSLALVVMGLLTLAGRAPMSPAKLLGMAGGGKEAEETTSVVKVPDATSRPACCSRE